MNINICSIPKASHPSLTRPSTPPHHLPKDAPLPNDHPLAWLPFHVTPFLQGDSTAARPGQPPGGGGCALPRLAALLCRGVSAHPHPAPRHRLLPGHPRWGFFPRVSDLSDKPPGCVWQPNEQGSMTREGPLTGSLIWLGRDPPPSPLFPPIVSSPLLLMWSRGLAAWGAFLAGEHSSPSSGYSYA